MLGPVGTPLSGERHAHLPLVPSPDAGIPVRPARRPRAAGGAGPSGRLPGLPGGTGPRRRTTAGCWPPRRAWSSRTSTSPPAPDGRRPRGRRRGRRADAAARQEGPPLAALGRGRRGPAGRRRPCGARLLDAARLRPRRAASSPRSKRSRRPRRQQMHDAVRADPGPARPRNRKKVDEVRDAVRARQLKLAVVGQETVAAGAPATYEIQTTDLERSARRRRRRRPAWSAQDKQPVGDRHPGRQGRRRQVHRHAAGRPAGQARQPAHPGRVRQARRPASGPGQRGSEPRRSGLRHPPGHRQADVSAGRGGPLPLADAGPLQPEAGRRGPAADLRTGHADPRHADAGARRRTACRRSSGEAERRGRMRAGRQADPRRRRRRIRPRPPPGRRRIHPGLPRGQQPLPRAAPQVHRQ